MTRRRHTLVLNPIACDGSGVCAELLPEYIRLDPWGYPVIQAGEIAPHLLDHAQKAVRSCPRLALTMVDAHPPAERRRPSVDNRSDDAIATGLSAPVYTVGAMAEGDMPRSRLG